MEQYESMKAHPEVSQSEPLSSETVPPPEQQKIDESELIKLTANMIIPIKDGDFVVLQYPQDANMNGIKRLMSSLEAHMKSLDIKVPVIFLSNDFKVFVLRKENAEDINSVV